MKNEKIQTQEAELVQDLRRGRFDKLKALSEENGFLEWSDFQSAREYRNGAHSEENGFLEWSDFQSSQGYRDYMAALEDRRGGIKIGYPTRYDAGVEVGSLQNNLEGYRNGFIALREEGKTLDVLAGGVFKERFIIEERFELPRSVVEAKEIREIYAPFLFFQRDVSEGNLFKMLDENGTKMRKVDMFPSSDFRRTHYQIASIFGAPCIGGLATLPIADYYIHNPWVGVPLQLAGVGAVLIGLGCSAFALCLAGRDKDSERENLQNPNFKYGKYAIREIAK